MVKKFTIPFASQGDANDIPDALQVDGKVSFTQGFGYDYERPYDDPQAKDIAREDMNGLFKAITSAVGELQTLGASEWSNAISYPKGAIVYYEKDLYISQVDDNQNTPPQSWVSITSIASDSLKKAANLSDLTNKATARNNLGLGSSATLNKTDVLGTSTSLVATQKLVNDTKINLDNSVRAVDVKADNAQNRADSAYNLANSKWSPQATTGTGNIARMSEVDKKIDKSDTVGSGKVMREGAYGVGSSRKNQSAESTEELVKIAYKEKMSSFSNSKPLDFTDINKAIFVAHNDDRISMIGVKGNNVFLVDSSYAYWSENKVVNYSLVQFKTDRNTSTDSSGFLRASGSKETFTKDLVTQSTGSSTTSVMSQKAVTDLVKINTASKNQNGWWKCGDTGLIYQWGTTSSISASVIEIVTPVVFHSILSAHVSTKWKGVRNEGNIASYITIENNKLFITADYTQNTDAAPRFWFAVGY